MGSQTLEILRQGVWASLTGGYFYDPHQGVFCNVVHLYLWLYLLCSPFVAYLYFPSTWLTWCVYMVTTTLTILVVKLANMALHQLYDRAQSMSEANLKKQFFKVTKETEPRDDETGIELKVMGVDGSRNSVEHAINEASEENSMLSIENTNSIIDLKVDVHRKNSSESIELMLYAPSMLSGSSQQDQQSLAGSASVSKSIRSASGGVPSTNTGGDTYSKYLTVYPELVEATSRVSASAESSGITGSSIAGTTLVATTSRQPHLSRKCSEVFNRRHHRRRLERQYSLDVGATAASESNFGSRLMRNQSDTIATAGSAGVSSSLHGRNNGGGDIGGLGPVNNVVTRNDTFLHSQLQPKTNSILSSMSRASNASRQHVVTSSISSGAATASITQSNPANGTTPSSSTGTKSLRLQRHRSSETHDERLKHQNRTLFQPIHHEQQHPRHHHQLHHAGSSGASSIGALAVIGGGISDSEDIEIGLGGSSGGVEENRGRALQSWILDSSSDVYLEDDSFTKSDLFIEQLVEARTSLQQLRHLHSQYQQQYRAATQHHHLPHHHHHHHLGANSIRKDPASTMSALQLSVAAPVSSSAVVGNGSSKSSGAIASGTNSGTANTTTVSSGSNMKRRRHSNATSYYKIGTQSVKSSVLSSGGQLTSGVRRIKSAALEVPCAQPSVLNLNTHPNSVEAISGQQQMRNPLPPPSKCLVRNQHLNLYPRLVDQNYADSSSTCSSLNFAAASTCGSTTALIEPPVYPIVEHSDEKASLDLTKDELKVADIESDGTEDDEVKYVNVGFTEVTNKASTKSSHDGDTNFQIDNGDADAIESNNAPALIKHKSFGSHQTQHSAESDVGGILAGDGDDDDDVFKDFDDNLENILSELQHTQNQLDDVLKSVEGSQGAERCEEQHNQNNADGSTNLSLVDDDDDETDNNGSRSPLLSGTRNRPTVREIVADKALRNEIAAAKHGDQQVPQQHQQQQQLNHNQVIKSEADSGCPSSDCEQVSASSKDQLLAGMELPAKLKSNEATTNDTVDCEQPSTSKMAATKNLGAIPKVIRYQEINETHNEPCTTQLHMRRSVRHDVYPYSNSVVLTTATHTLSECNTKQEQLIAGTNLSKSVKTVSSRRASTSSSTSARSVSAENLTADIHKMLWLMHGGAVDDRGRPIAGIAADGTPIPAHPNIVPPNMSSAHFQFYQDAIQQALHSTYPSQSIENLERSYFRDKLRLDSKQVSEPAVFELPTQLNGNATATTTASQVISTAASTYQQQQQHHQGTIGMLMSTSSSAAAGLNSRNIAASNGSATTATLSLQGLINVIRNERTVIRSSTGMDALNNADGIGSNVSGIPIVPGTADGSVGPSTSTNVATSGNNGGGGVAILNVDGPHFGQYCDFWRPPCLLSAEKPIIPKSFYKYRFNCCGYEREFKISMDRLQLLALFDRDLHWIHIVFSLILSALVAYLGARILQHCYYKDMFAFLFCAVIASAQYSLVKSVQPDAASPIHGFNKTVAYSRSIYFTICSALLLLLKQLTLDYAQQPQQQHSELKFFGAQYSPADVTTALLQFMYIVMLCFPLIFSLGLFPQINTFLMYLLEQIDMHVFGGNAASSLLGSCICVLRSVLAVILLYGPLYAALAEARGTQYILFSIFCAMLIPIGYHLSRSASDFSHVWRLIKTCIVSTYREDDDEISAASAVVSTPNGPKVNTSTPKHSRRHHRSKSTGQNKQGSSSMANSNENIELSSMEKLPMRDFETQSGANLENKHSKSKTSSLGSSQTLGKTISSSKKAITASSSFASIGGNADEGTTGIPTSEVGNELASAAVSADMDATEKPNKITVNVADDVVGESVIVDPVEQSIPVNIIENNPTNDEQVGVAVAAISSAENKKVLDFVNSGDDRVSNSSTNPGDISTLTAGGPTDAPTAVVNSGVVGNATSESCESELPDPLPRKLQNTVNTRLKNDIVVMTLLAVSVLGLHCSTVFTVLQPDLNVVLYAFTGALGMLLHYIIPQMRKHMPWLCFARPILRQKEYGQFEVSNAPKIMWFEKVYIYLCLIERNVLFPLLAISALTADAQLIANKFGVPWGTLIVAVCALKFVRNSYSDPTNQYLIVLFTVLLFRIDFTVATETFIIDYFFVSLAFRKCCDFLLKLQFIVTYIAPWQITWGSAFHAFAQPFSVPHSAMLFLQAAVSAVFSTPLNPFLGSAIFLTSYVRPIKFWERDYNTRRIDHSNTRLSSQLERDLGADDNNLNSIFYEHLTRSLQHSLCGDLLMGRWGNVNQGDCFVLASDYLNCLVHIIELGNGLCTFQMRGLEFRGTYCQQREVEAITEGVEDNDGCCCCDPGHLPRMLSANAMFSTRWLAWQVVAAQYVLEGYSISDNLASATLQVFEYRKVLITYYIKSIIYYVVKNPKLEQWLAPGPIQDALQPTLSRQFVDLDPIFNFNLDEDFDFRAFGITRSSFCYVYLKWINFCVDKRREAQNSKETTAPATTTTAPAAGCGTAAPENVQSAAAQAAAYNDSKSTPNLSTHSNTTPQSKSQSQQQLRSVRPQKSATMSGSATVNNTNSSEHMASSHSFANISRQTSESAPGLSGVGLGVNYVNYMENAAVYNQASAAATVTLGVNMQSVKSQGKTIRKEDLNTAADSASKEGSENGREKQTLKLKVASVAKDAPLVSLCLALGLLARRSLATASHSSLTGVEFFLHGLHALFKGDFRITSPRDEWVFADMELLHSVVAPAVKMALKLQQDHISNPDEFLDPNALYEGIDTCSKELVISHEADPVWRSAVLKGAPNLLALRHVMEDGSDEYRIIRLTKRFLSFRVIKLNRECVRGLWAGQQQELIYLRNRNPERGSIQNAKQALRNIINSSCDQPIGYPIYVSPLTTSYADTNNQLCDVIGGAITLESIKTNVLNWWHKVRERCRQGCSSGSAMEASNLGVCNFGSGIGTGSVGGGGGGVVGTGIATGSVGGESGDLAPVFISAPLYNTLTVNNYFGVRSGNVGNIGGSLAGTYVSDSLAVVRGGLAVMPVKPTSTTLIAGLLNREREQERGTTSDGVALREVTALRSSGSGQRRSAMQRCAEREQRATLPIPNVTTATNDHKEIIDGEKNSDANEVMDSSLNYNSSSRYVKVTSSSTGNIITTPGDYPRKTKGPICLTAATLATEATASTGRAVDMAPRKPRIEIFRKVIIVDDTEIYDCLDLIDAVVWPNEHMRANGGRVSWKDWEPTAGMVGYVVHCWIPNHSDPRFRSHVNRIVYLIEIGEHYVPVEELGLREYNQIMGSSEEMANSRRSSIQREFDEYNLQLKLAGLTPILGSSLESPSRQLTAVCSEAKHRCVLANKPKIQAVSSSSSSDDEDVPRTSHPHVVDMKNFNTLLNMWKLIADKKKNASTTSEQLSTDEFEGFDYDSEQSRTLRNEVNEDDNENNDAANAAENIDTEAIKTIVTVATTDQTAVQLSENEDLMQNTESSHADTKPEEHKLEQNNVEKDDTIKDVLNLNEDIIHEETKGTAETNTAEPTATIPKETQKTTPLPTVTTIKSSEKSSLNMQHEEFNADSNVNNDDDIAVAVEPMNTEPQQEQATNMPQNDVNDASEV